MTAVAGTRTSNESGHGRHSWVVVLVVALFVGGAAFTFVGLSGSDSGDWHLLAVSSFAGTIVLIPMMRSGYPMSSVWTPTAAAVVIGFFLHSVAIVLEYPDAETIDGVFLRGRQTTFLANSGASYLPSIALMTGTYWLLASRTARRKLAVSRMLTGQVSTLRLAAFALLTISVIALWLLIRATGGLSFDRISAKRSLLVGTDAAGSGLQSFGYLRSIAATSVLGVILLLRSWSGHLNILRMAVLIGALSIAVAYPFYISNRSDIVGVLASVVVAASLMRVRVTKRQVFALGLIPVLLVSFATVTRNVASSQPLSSSTLSQGLIDPFLTTRHFADLSKTAHVEDAAGQELAYANGSTYAAWIVAPVPRAIWPTKPLISSGKVIGTVVYDNPRTGVPPGAFGEAVWNFGPAAIPLVAILLGACIGYLDRKFARRELALTGVLIYSTAVFRFGEKALSQSFGEAIFNLLFSGLVAVLVGRFVEASSGRRRAVSG